MSNEHTEPVSWPMTYEVVGGLPVWVVRDHEGTEVCKGTDPEPATYWAKKYARCRGINMRITDGTPGAVT